MVDEQTVRASGAQRTPVRGGLSPGARVGRYQVLGLVARGGMGEVYAAYHPDLDRRIALKVVYGPRGWERDRQYRLLREAQIIARLNHPNIVTVHDARMVGERVYVAMEFVDGQTIAGWLREAERPWQHIVAAFYAAGRGLAAAHAAKVVHRDFKPQNVMIGIDGRVRVMDFGVARPLLEATEEVTIPTARSATDSLTSTTIGALVGTPAYMAPEQLRGCPADTRSDQFSFCVALHEAIYGIRPGSLNESGIRRSARVPAWLKRIIRRGLDPDPQRRFASMEELLRAIERGTNRLRRQVVLAAAACLVVLAAVVFARASRAREFACTPPRARLEAIWPADEAPNSRRAAIHRVFSSSGMPDAQAAWASVAAALDDRFRRWTGMYQDACEATHLRGEQSAEVLDLRMTCLSDKLDETRAYTDALLWAAPDGVGRALGTATALAPVDQCADVRTLRLQIPPPADPRVRAEAERVQKSLNDADILLSFQSGRKAERVLQAVLPAAQAAGYKPLLAQALQRLGLAQAMTEHFEAARETAQGALYVAEACRDDLDAAKATVILADVDTVRGRHQEAAQWLALGDSIVERAHAQDSLVAAWLANERGNLYYQAGDFLAAADATRTAIALKTKLVGPDSFDVGVSAGNLAITLEELDRWDEALSVVNQTIATCERYPDQHARYCTTSVQTKAEILLHLGRLDEAGVALSRAMRMQRANSDEETLLLSTMLADWGELSLAAHRPRDAIPVLQRAQAMQADVGERDSIRLAVTRADLARAFVEVGHRRSDAYATLANACWTLSRGHYARRQRELLDWFNQLPERARRPAATSCDDLAQASGRAISPPTSTTASAGSRPRSPRGRSTAVTAPGAG